VKIPRSIRPGDLVRVRRARWRIVDVRAYERCDVVTLSAVGESPAGVERRVLTPFETIDRLERIHRTRRVRATRWRRACRGLLAADVPPAGLRSAAHARIDLLPFQLEPAMAVVRGMGSRLLIADEVGLGKTIQAGLIVSELAARAAIDRVLVLTPAGLRDQWAHELGDRFGIDADPVDGPMLRRLAADLPVGLNPWSTVATAIASIDYVKRAEVLPAAAAPAWDLLIVDEAHGVAGDSGRHAAVRALAARAVYVVLLTATPHSGDRRTFASLCEIGALDDAPLLVFRRTRAEVGAGGSRRVHALHVRLSPHERRMHAMLAAYGDAVRGDRPLGRTRDACLALSVLHKRALSSPWSLAQSVDRRLAALDAASVAPDDGEQLALPLDDGDGDLVAADEAPRWPADLHLSDPRRERRLLDALAAAARVAAGPDAKLSALARLLRRARESAVVFTEYRDTLIHVRERLAGIAGLPQVIVMHGGLRRDERRAALAEFAGAKPALLLATDAAAEGLNLHRGCRLVVNLELPWNPMRLEQRIGRVDRIGQTQTVHAFHLVAGGTGEPRILARLRARLAVARADLGAPDPLGDDDDGAIARLGVTGANEDDDGDGRSPGRGRC
jgi:superfamily II DNA or RNA helicase